MLDAQTLENDERAEIARLAALNPLQYDRQRAAAAEQLDVSVSALDKAVKGARSEQADTKGQGRPLELPSIDPWPDPVNGAELLDAICSAIRRHVVMPEGSADAMALWALSTHCYDCFNHSPRLAITSPEKRCGKTTTLDLLRELVARALPTSNVTVSAVFRTIEIAKPTLLIDEADTFLKENEELRGVLNSGHRKGASIIRTVGEDYEPRQFSTWAPAAIAMIGNLPATLDDRSIVVRLRRRKPTERVQAFRGDRPPAEFVSFARKAARWAQDHATALIAADPDMTGLINRAADNWRPLFAIADAAGGKWPKHVRAIANVAEENKEDQSVRTMLLADIRDIFTARPHSDRIGSTELAVELGSMEGRPWIEWGRTGKPMTAAALSRMLSPFGILSGTKRSGSDTFKGYLYAEFDEVFSSYLATSASQTVTPSQPNNHGHCDAFQTVTSEEHVTLSKASQPNNHGHCDGVTVLKGEASLNGNGHPPEPCAQCRREPLDGKERLVAVGNEQVWLHQECARFYRRDHSDDLTIPSYLDRRSELQRGRS